MITEQELKSDCTPEIVKRMCELAEGFKHLTFIPDENDTLGRQINLIVDWSFFPLLIHRAVEGWNKKNGSTIYIKNNSVNYCDYPVVYDDTYYWYNDYQTSSLTPCECACLHCLIEVLG